MNFSKNNIEAVIFDLGGVILNIDIQGTFQKFKQLGIGPQGDVLELLKNHNIFNSFETGKLSPDQFRDEIRKVSGNGFSNQTFDDIWNSMILDFPEENIRFLERVKPRYRTFLMSNTNKIHCDYYSEILHKSYGYKNLDELLEKAYYSHTSGMRKPDAGFYEHILNENDLKPQHTLFIDDFAENIEAAGKLGIQTVHLTNGMSINTLGL